MRLALLALLLMPLSSGCQKATPVAAPVSEVAAPEVVETQPPAPVPPKDPAKSDARKNVAIPPGADLVATSIVGSTIYPQAVRTVTFDPAGETLVVGDGWGDIHIIDVATRDRTKRLQAHENWTFDLAFSADGSRLASAGGDNLIKLYDPTNWELATTLTGHTDDAHGVAFTPDGTSLLSGSDDQSVLIWQIDTGESQEIGQHDKQVTSLVISPDGQWAATGSRDDTVRIWDLEKLALHKTLTGHTADVIDVAFSHDGRFLLSAGNDQTARVWSTKDWTTQHTYGEHKASAYAAIYSEDDQFILTASGDNFLRVYAHETGELTDERDLKAMIADISIRADGLIGVGLTSGNAGFLQLADGKIEGELTLIPLKRPAAKR